jgi:hypothetical protein
VSMGGISGGFLLLSLSECVYSTVPFDQKVWMALPSGLVCFEGVVMGRC